MSMSSNDPSDRRSFLTTLATGSAAIAAGVMALPHVADAAPAAAVDGANVDEAWLGKLTGKHKQFFDAVTVNDGFPMGFAMNFLNVYNDAYKIPDANLSAVVGLRHFSIPLAFTDDIWKRYKLGEFTKAMDPATKTPATRNIYYHAHDGELMMAGMAIEKLQARGVVFTVCNMALTILSGLMAPNAGVTADVAKKEWTAGLIPGMVLVPAGVIAVNRAQEKGCAYCFAG
ncbi:MAG: twin-arginine translocation signal domain-containing protein [bacterium]